MKHFRNIGIRSGGKRRFDFVEAPPENLVPVWLVLLLTKIAYVDGASNIADEIRKQVEPE